MTPWWIPRSQALRLPKTMWTWGGGPQSVPGFHELGRDRAASPGMPTVRVPPSRPCAPGTAEVRLGRRSRTARRRSASVRPEGASARREYCGHGFPSRFLGLLCAGCPCAQRPSLLCQGPAHHQAGVLAAESDRALWPDLHGAYHRSVVVDGLLPSLWVASPILDLSTSTG